MYTTSSDCQCEDQVLETASTARAPAVFVISPPPSSAAARFRQRYQNENRTPADHSLNSSTIRTKKPLSFELDHNLTEVDEASSITKFFGDLNLDPISEEAHLPDAPDYRAREAFAEMTQRVLHLNQVIEELTQKNSSLENAIADHRDEEMALQIEIEHKNQIIHDLKNKLSIIEQDKRNAEKKAKLNYCHLERQFNAIRFKDKQYKNELRKRELECEKIQKKLRSMMISCKTGVEPSSLRSCLQKQKNLKPSNADLQKDFILLREDNHRMDKRLRAVCQENTRMRELFSVIIKKMQIALADDYSMPSNGLDLNLPFDFSGEQLKVSVMELLEKFVAAVPKTPFKSSEQSDDDSLATIHDLKQIIEQQAELIRRAIFKEPETLPTCNSNCK